MYQITSRAACITWVWMLSVVLPAQAQTDCADEIGNVRPADRSSTRFATGGPKVVNAFPIPAGAHKCGLAWDGQYLWAIVTTSGYGAGTQNALFKLNGNTGVILETIPYSGIPFAADLAWDGTHFRVSDVLDDRIYRVTSSGAVVDFFPSPGSGPYGLAFDGTDLLNADFESDVIFRLNAETGAVIDSFVHPDTNASGLAWDGASLWANGRASGLTYELHPVEGSVISSFPTPGAVLGGNAGQGAAASGANLWLAEWDSATIFQLDIDVDECAEGTDNCDDNSTCTNTPGSFTCACNAGYSGDGVTCTDDDECTLGTDDCDINATCTNTPGSFTCTCNSGYSGDGVTCTDDDECVLGTDNCDINATCTNTPGSFICTCNDGYSGGGAPLFTDSGQALGDDHTFQALADDIDNDGDADIVSLEEGFNKVQIYLNDGTGVFLYSPSLSFTRPAAHRSGALADLDGDGNLDLVIGGAGSGTGVTVYSGDGSGGFTVGWSHTWPFVEIEAVSVGDVDGDGSPDIVAAGSLSDEQSIQVCLNAGVNTYTCSEVSSGTSAVRDVVLVDLDSDTDLDLAAASDSAGPFDPGEIKIFLNDSGALTSTGQPITAEYPYGLDAGDLDGDGDVDLAVGIQASVPNLVFFNDGAGGFADSGQSLGAEATNDVVLGDIDMDGDLDLVAINEGHNGRGYVVYGNNGSGTLAEQEFGSNNFKSSGALVDVDGDLDLDLVTGDYATGASNNHAPNQVFINTGGVCVDNDECTLGTDNCDVHATCTNTPGSFTCMCNSGYSGDGVTCADDDECALGTDNCDENAACTNTPGSFTCTCNTGYVGDGVTCQVDCQPNGVADAEDLAAGTSQDCNTNAIPDECDLAGGASDDCDANSVPDECQPDGDGDEVIDACDPCPLDHPDDTDGDGVCDSSDICPGGDDALDDDGDGVPDDCDLCFGDAATGDADTDGICNDLDEDDDNDGCADVADPAPLIFSPDPDADDLGNDCDEDDDNDGCADIADPEPLVFSLDTDGDALGNDCDQDDDNDGVGDEADPAPLIPELCGDSDEDTCDDCSIGTDGFGPLPDNDPADDGPDADSDGVCDAGDICAGGDDTVDSDGDGVPDDCDCRADLNNDGSVNAADLALLLGAWGPCSGCPADFDDDGFITAADLAHLLGHWGPCD